MEGPTDSFIRMSTSCVYSSSELLFIVQVKQRNKLLCCRKQGGWVPGPPAWLPREASLGRLKAAASAQGEERP